MSKTLKVGTRGSQLALAQTGLMISALEKANPELSFERVIIRTAGDRDQSTNIADVGYSVFVSELESALAAGDVDIAVHSMKDMPSELGDDFCIAAVPYREDPRDVLISRDGSTLDDLPNGATVGTGSARRKALLLDKRPDLQVLPIRGNVPTRLEKLNDPEGPDAVVLASAGLNRLGITDRKVEYLKCWDFVSAVGQGALALETRANHTVAQAAARPLQDEKTRLAVDAERAFLAAMQSGCSAPVSAHAKVTGDRISIHTFASHPSGSPMLRADDEGPTTQSIEMALALAKDLLAKGAGKFTSRPEANQ